MTSDDELDDPELKAAIAASLQGLDGPGNANDSASSNPPEGVVDLTADSDDEVVEVYPKSKSVVGSETDDDEDEIEDEDLRRAIQMSMRVPEENHSRNVEEEEDDDDDDDAELKRAIQMSLRDEPAKGSDASKPQTSDEKDNSTSLPSHFKEGPVPIPNPPKPSQTVSLSGLDRKQMEQERLARLAKRKAEEAPTSQPEAKQTRTESQPSGNYGPESSLKSPIKGGSESNEGKSKRRPQSDSPSTTPSVQFPTGVVKKTWNRHCPRNGDDIKIEEVFQASDLELAVLSSFMWDMEWIFLNMDTKSTRFLLIMQAKEESTEEHWKMKTAGSGESKTSFYEELVYFLKASTVNENIITKLDSFDFSQTTHIAFVHTIGGSHGGESWKRTGYCGLGQAISSLGLRTSTPLNIDYVTSSVGSLKDEFLQSIYLAAQGDSGLTEYTHRTRPKSQPKPDLPTIQGPKQNRFRVYFPSQETVASSPGGPNSAGTICFQSSWYENAKFPRGVLRDCRSIRGGLLMHNKIIYIRPDTPVQTSVPVPGQDGTKTTCPGWAYVGSANLSESAWGRLVQDRTTKSPKLNCRNWECGVVIPVLQQPGSPISTTEAKGKAPEMSTGAPPADPGMNESERALDVFHGTVPVPMVIPGRKYEGSSLKPWYFMES